MRPTILAALALALLSAPAWAQDKPFAPGGPTVSLAATGTTGAVQVQSGPNNTAVRVYNSGSVAVFLACGVSGVVATVAAGMPIAPGTVEIIGCNQTYVAGITGGTAATVYLTPGNGISRVRRVLRDVLLAVCATAAAAVMVAGVLMALLSVADARVKAGPNVVSAHHRLRTPPGALDGTVSTSVAAGYSFRLLRQAYFGGPSIRLRRASDQAESDFGFAGNGDWDGASAAAFCAATSCFVRAWYDQSGNGRHVGNPTAASQPALVFNCIGAKPCASINSTSQNIASASVAWTNAKKSLSIVATRASGTGICYFVMAQNNALRVQNANLWTVTDLVTQFDMAATEAAWHAGIGVINAASSAGSVDGVEGTPTAIAGNATAGSVTLAYVASIPASCSQTEMVIWDNYALTLAERAALTANQRAYWGF